MTDLTPPPASGRGLKIALALSVALNLAVAGLVAGALLNEGRDRGAPRELGLGPFTEALSQSDRRALRRSLLERVPELREARAAGREEIAALVTALRAEPFDPAAAQAAFSVIEARYVGWLELGRELIEARVLALSDADRLAFAERLESGLRRRD